MWPSVPANPESLHFAPVLATLLLVQHLVRPISDADSTSLSLYPAGTGSRAIRPSIAANRRRFRCPSTRRSQQYRACFTSRPPVFTSRCCKLVSDQCSQFVLVCSPEGGPDPQEFMTNPIWKTAKTYADAPHEYVLRLDCPVTFKLYEERIRDSDVAARPHRHLPLLLRGRLQILDHRANQGRFFRHGEATCHCLHVGLMLAKCPANQHLPFLGEVHNSGTSIRGIWRAADQTLPLETVYGSGGRAAGQRYPRTQGIYRQRPRHLRPSREQHSFQQRRSECWNRIALGE